MTLEGAPTPFHGVVLAVVRRVVGKSNVDLMLLHELHHAVQELASSATVLRTIILKGHKRVDLRKAGLVLGPPMVKRVDDAVAGYLRRTDRDHQLVVLGKEDPKGSDVGIGREVVVEGLNRHATFTTARKLTDLDGRLRVGGN